MDNNDSLPQLTRRGLLTATVWSIAGCSTIEAGEQQSMKSELELENERIVTQFCLDWSKRDIHLLADYLADDVVYQMFEGNPDIIGKDKFINTLEGFLKGMKEVEWEIIRTHSIGELVINDRIDHFVGEDESKSMHFSIAGWFLVRDSKIKLWRDYSLPGGISQVGGAFTGG